LYKKSLLYKTAGVSKQKIKNTNRWQDKNKTDKTIVIHRQSTKQNNKYKYFIFKI